MPRWLLFGSRRVGMHVMRGEHLFSSSQRYQQQHLRAVCQWIWSCGWLERLLHFGMRRGLVPREWQHGVCDVRSWFILSGKCHRLHSLQRRQLCRNSQHKRLHKLHWRLFLGK